MKKTTWIIIIISAILGIAFLTCPSEQEHRNTLISTLNSAINQKIDQECAGEEYGALAALLGSTISNYAVEVIINNRVRVENFFIISVGKLAWEGEENVCSIGCFDHVFCTSTDEIKKALDEE